MNASDTTQPNRSPFAAIASNGMLLMLASVLFFSASNILTKLAGDRLNAPVALISTSRFAFGFLLAALLFRGKEKVSFKALLTNPWLIARGLIGGTGVNFYNECIVHMDAGRTSIITSSYPIFATLLAPLLLPEPLRLKQFAYCILAFSGLLVMTGIQSFSSGFALWDLIAIGVAIASGFVVVLIRKLHRSANTATIFISQCAFGLLVSVPQNALSTQVPSLPASVVILASSVLVILGQLAMTHGYKTVNVSKGSSLHLLMPVFTMAASMIIFGERITTFGAIGGAFILFACYKISREK